MAALIKFPTAAICRLLKEVCAEYTAFAICGKVHYYLPDNGKCSDPGCSMMAGKYRGDGGISPHFLK
jgi:hypothetical protein